MSAPTGIAASQELSAAFSDVIESKDTRFLKVSIRNESLVPDGTFPSSGTLEEDLSKMQSILEDNVPAYVLARLDDPPSEWLVVYYVPDTAKVRDKMLYAATRNTLTKSLGSAHFTDSIFATSKDDVTAESYARHKQHLAAPKPMSAREKEMAAVKAAERQAGGSQYEGSRARQNHVGQGVGLKWTEDVENAVQELGNGEGSAIVVLSIDSSSETLLLSSVVECSVEALGASLPVSEPSYAFFAWSQSVTGRPKREIIFIYSCPSSSPIKHRMLYSSGASSVLQSAKGILSLSPGSSALAARRIETSDPAELTEEYLIAELGLDPAAAAASSISTTLDGEKKAFARPKGPGRKR
ncbi:hypothetical protein POSPLADRAFT_1178769 [Postia placenta MAD-698-R-SB12]|uniref:Twinfilin n=1 Tax=Postia placenta MAD-698-R-SB12 TaxID=670580 RepID=A0A1X6N986_9APHY|nr:hypothetical protein POSPLADRAFT_1178769 [Postia placenta MAD-698-R-SB12]OSX65124.1 hypothetical protein POSPLADRAFT_1178769 [Postia placenta MAD-698-R-SB12]